MPEARVIRLSGGDGDRRSLRDGASRPPRDGQMAFVRSPDLHSIELLQKGDALPPQEPWSSMQNTGHW